MTKRLSNLLTIAALTTAMLAAGAAPAWAGQPTTYIKRNTQQVNELLRQSASEQRRAKFSKKVNAVVDFRELASRALGEHWKQRTDQEQDTFLSLLQNLLEANYQKKLEGNTLGKDYQVDYLDEKTRDNLAIVETKITWDGGSKPAEYKLMKKDGDWIIYDMIIDDISLVETYRDSYTKIIEQDGWNELIDRMRRKAKKLRAQNQQ